MIRYPRHVRRAASAAGIAVAVSGLAARAQTVIDPTLEVTTWASGVLRPTSFAILPGGPPLDVLVCEKETGRVIFLRDGVIQGTAVDVAVNYQSERGLLGIALHPNFNANGFVYIYDTPSTGSDTAVSGNLLDHRVDRYTWNGATLGALQPILTLPSAGGPNHDGGVIRFGPDDMLYGVIGDLNRNGQLENFPLGSPPDDTGIVFRIAPDGSAPVDNPFTTPSDSMQIVYAYGIRNSFGLAFDPVTGDLWDTENGPGSYDEINRVLPGFNSGWEQIMGPDSRDPQGIGNLWMAAGAAYSDPEFSWLSPVGVTSICFLRDGVLGATHDGMCLVGDNNTGTLYRFELDVTRTSLVMPTAETADQVADSVDERNVFRFGSGFGVVTGLEVGPDGLYVASHFSNRIYRIAPAPTDTGQTLGVPHLRVLPNPGAGRTVVQLVHGNPQARIEARIYSPDGRLVRRLSGVGPEIDWDGRDTHGESLAAGVYLLQLEAGALALEAKIIRVR